MSVHGFAHFSAVLIPFLLAERCGGAGAANGTCAGGSCHAGTDRASVLLQTKALAGKTSLSGFLEEAQEEQAQSDLPKECWVLPPEGIEDVEKVPHRRVLLSAKCPLQCPFSQLLAGDPCFKACVQGGKHGCAQLHPLRIFPNPVTLDCEEPCGNANGDADMRVVGCAECAEQGICRRCMMGYDLKDGGRSCENKLQIVWQVVYVLLFLSIGVVTVYAVTLCCRPVTNKAMLAHAELHQELCRPWMLQTDDEDVIRQKYPLWWTHAYEQDISGLGVLLYFRWLRFLLFVGFVLLTATSLAWFVALNHDLEELGETIENATASLENATAPQLHVPSFMNFTMPGMNWSMPGRRKFTFKAQACPNETMPTLIGEGTIEAYPSAPKPVMSARSVSLLEWWWKPKTRRPMGGNRRGRATEAGRKAQEDMMRPAGDPHKYPERMFLALSLAYAVIILSSLVFASHQARIKTRRDDVRLIHGDFVLRVDGLPPSATGAAELKTFFQGVLNEAAAGVDNASRNKFYRIEGVSIAFSFYEHEKTISSAIDQFVQEIEAEYPCLGKVPDLRNSDADAAAGTAAIPRGRSRLHAPCRVIDSLIVADLNLSPSKQWKEDVRQVLQEIEGSGTAYIITSSKLAAERLLLLQGTHYWTGEELSFRNVRAEPPDILWCNIGKKVTWLEIAYSIRLLLCTIIGWMLFYVPYAMHYTDLTRAPDEESTFMQDIVLGLLISAGNQMVGVASDITADTCAFIEKDIRDVVVLFLAFVSTFANTVCDLGMVLIIARSVELDNALIGIALEGGYDRALARELMSLLVPGYLIMPHVMAPIFEYFIPVYTARLIVGSTPGVAKGVAENALMCPDFDINWRYVDVLTNFMVCFTMLFFATPNTWRIMIFMMIFVVLIHSLDHFKLLRQTSQTFYTTDALSIAFTYCWGLPTACLAGAAAFWGARSGMLRMSEHAALSFAIPLHCIVYVFAVSLVLATVPAPRGRKDMLYEDVRSKLRQQGKAYDFFNTNPVHVLREYLLEEQERELTDLRCVPYVRGKEYLQMDVTNLKFSRSLGTTAAEVLGSLASHARRIPATPASNSGIWRRAAHRLTPMLHLSSGSPRSESHPDSHSGSFQDSPHAD